MLNISSELVFCCKSHQINPIYFNIYSPNSSQVSPVIRTEDIVTHNQPVMQTYPLYKKREHTRIPRSCSWSL
jgi:hypothetical protein